MEMQKRVFFLYAILLWVAGGMSGTVLAQDEIPWLENYSQAMREAKRNQKPIFLEFRCEA
jgi:hypothetical protein